MDDDRLGRVFSVDLSCKFWRDKEYYDSGSYRGAFDLDGVDNPGESVSSISSTSRHEAVILDFEEAVRTGREPLVTTESARNTTELVLRIYKGEV